MSDINIRTTTTTVRNLLGNVRNGKFAIPRLQREFVWDGRKAAKLLDSIYQGMPIGIILIWRTSKSHQLHLRKHYHILPAFNDLNPEIWFLIDGQQRISVLYHVREGSSLNNSRGRPVDFKRVVFCLDHQDGDRVIYRKPVEGSHVELWKILAQNWRHAAGRIGKYPLKRVEECRRRLLDYKVPVLFAQMSIDQVKESFFRVNTQGMKITTAERIIGELDELEPRDFLHEIRGSIDSSFKHIPDEPILWMLAAAEDATDISGKTVDRALRKVKTQVEKNQKRRKEIAEKWSRLRHCFGKAIDYLRLNFKVLSPEFLYSPYMISMLALFYYRNGSGPSRRQREEIRKWYWATTVGSRYSGQKVHRCIPYDLKFFARLAEKGRASFHFTNQVDTFEVRKAQYGGRSGIACAFYTLLLKKSPVSLLEKGLNEIPLDRYSTRANRKDRHHIFPRGLMSGFDVEPENYNSICNVCLLTAEENQIIGLKRPKSYLGELRAKPRLFKQKMKRHLIPVDNGIGIWDLDVRKGFRRFIRIREKLICNSLEKEAGIRLFRKDR